MISMLNFKLLIWFFDLTNILYSHPYFKIIIMLIIVIIINKLFSNFNKAMFDDKVKQISKNKKIIHSDLIEKNKGNK